MNRKSVLAASMAARHTVLVVLALVALVELAMNRFSVVVDYNLLEQYMDANTMHIMAPVPVANTLLVAASSSVVVEYYNLVMESVPGKKVTNASILIEIV